MFQHYFFSPLIVYRVQSVWKVTSQFFYGLAMIWLDIRNMPETTLAVHILHARYVSLEAQDYKLTRSQHCYANWKMVEKIFIVFWLFRWVFPSYTLKLAKNEKKIVSPLLGSVFHIEIIFSIHLSHHDWFLRGLCVTTFWNTLYMLLFIMANIFPFLVQRKKNSFLLASGEV